MLQKVIHSVLIAGFTLCSVNQSFAQPSSTVTNNIARAHSLLTDVYQELNYNNVIGDLAIHVHGSFKYQGHYSAPNEVKEYKMSSHITFEENGKSLERVDSFSRINSVVLSSYKVAQDQIKANIEGEDVNTTDADRDKYLYQSAIYFPNLMLQLMLENAAKNTFIGTVDGTHIVRHDNRSGDVFFMYINSKTYFPERVDQPMYDPVSGDYYISTFYDHYDLFDGFQTPKQVVVKKDSNIIYNLKVDIEEILPEIGGSSITLRQKKVGEWLYVIPLQKWNTKAVLADMKDFIVVFEPPSSPEAGYALIDNINKAYPGKEIKYCIISHHHPDHMGGIRPFIEKGITIVTTKGNEEYINEIASNKHLFSPTVRAKKNVIPKFLFITQNGYEIKTLGTRTIRLYLLNKKSNHTNEYIISYIPTEKILIEGDLIKTWDLRQRSLDRREKGLIEYLSDNKINVKQVIQTWPLEKAPLIFDYELIKPEPNSKFIRGSKKVLEVFTGDD